MRKWRTSARRHNKAANLNGCRSALSFYSYFENKFAANMKWLLTRLKRVWINCHSCLLCRRGAVYNEFLFSFHHTEVQLFLEYIYLINILMFQAEIFPVISVFYLLILQIKFWIFHLFQNTLWWLWFCSSTYVIYKRNRICNYVDFAQWY